MTKPNNANLMSELLSGVSRNHAAADITPVGDTQIVSAIVRESAVDLEFRRRRQDPELISSPWEYYIRVKVWCKTRTNLFRFTDVRVSGSRDEMAQKVGSTAGVIAEQLCALYGNGSAEPRECAIAGGKHFYELCRHLEAQAAS